MTAPSNCLLCWSLLTHYFTLLLAVSAVVIVGCNRGPELGVVSGTVTWEGQPLEGATVTFTPEDGQTSRSRTIADGSYKLKFADGRFGTMLGENEVSIESYRISTGADGNPVEHPEILPPRFHLESEMTRTVVPGEQVINFDLTKD